jgi:hypothetical protein
VPEIRSGWARPSDLPGTSVQEIPSYAEAGYTHVCVHQIGADQEAFLKFAKSELSSRF